MFNIARALPATLGLMVACFIVPMAHAQGTSDKLPDPISYSELSSIGKRLLLSDQQFLAIDRLYTEYRRQFQVLRNGPIEQVLQLESQAFAERLPRTMNQIAEVDDAFFEQVQTILADDQLPLLERTRLMRERQRYAAVHFVRLYSTGAFADLSAILHDELSITPSEAVADVLEAYEQQLTSGMRAFFLHAASVAGGDENAMVRMLDRGSQIRALNLRTLTTLEGLLDSPVGDELRYRFMTRAYAIVRGLSRLGVEGQYAAALGMDISDQQREAIVHAWDDIRRQRRSLQQQAATLWDDHGRIRSSFDDSGLAVHEQLRDLRRRASEINSNAERQLHAMFDEQVVERLKQVATRSIAGGESHSLTGSNGYIFQTVTAPTRPPAPPQPAAASTRRLDQFLPEPMPLDDLTFYSRMLRVHERLASDLEALHQAYVEWFDTAIKSHSESIDRLWDRGRLGSSSGSEEALRDELQRIDDLFNERRRAQATIRQVDERLMQHLAGLLSPDHQAALIQRVRLARQRQLHDRGLGLGLGNDPNRAATVNLVAIAAEHLQQQQLAERQDLLLDYEREIAAALQRRYEALWQRQYNGDRMFPLIRLDEAGGDSRLHDDYVAMQRAVRDAHRAVAEVNQRFVVELAHDLPDQQQADLIDAFNRIAYPQVFQDPGAAGDALMAAFALDDLTNDQRSALGEIAAEFWPEYRQLTQAMIDLTAAHYGDIPANLTMGDADLARQREAYANEEAQLRFRRDAVHLRAIQGLRAALSSEQIRRIGGLPDPGEERAGR